jgi:hypothetical protein
MKIYCKYILINKWLTKCEDINYQIVDNKWKADHIILERVNYHAENFKNNSIYLLDLPLYDNELKSKYRKKFKWKARKGDCIHNLLIESEGMIDKISQTNSFFFTTDDVCGINQVIPTFITGTPNKLIGKEINYNMKENLPENNKFNNSVYSKFSERTHRYRKTFFNFYEGINDPRFKIRKFRKNIYKGQGEGTAINYDRYISKLCSSDISYVIRGDRTWTFSLHDVLRAGCVPVMINSFNNYGWENICENVDDFMLRFDLNIHSMDYIHESVCELLSDKKRLLKMKNNVKKLYDVFFSSSFNENIMLFKAAKCIDILKNNFQINKIENKMICKEVLSLKNLNSKL